MSVADAAWMLDDFAQHDDDVWLVWGGAYTWTEAASDEWVGESLHCVGF